MSEPQMVLVTGASGFIAIHCVQALLAEGYRVRGSVRSLDATNKVAPLRQLSEAGSRLELVQADLLQPDTWLSAVKDCDFVVHVASPLVVGSKNEEELIRPAMEGTLNVLQACLKSSSVRRVVLTSSIMAICHGHGKARTMNKVFTEEDWTEISGKDVFPYVKSKKLAEEAAWDFMEEHRKAVHFQLTTLCPSLVFGPMLSPMLGYCSKIVKDMMERKHPMIPKYSIPCVDVRDVATAHVRALTTPQAAGQRIIVSAQALWFKDLAQALHQHFAPKRYPIRKKEAPNWAVALYSLRDKSSAAIRPRLGWLYDVDNSRMKEWLGIDPISPKDSVVEMAQSLIDFGIVKKKKRKTGTKIEAAVEAAEE